MMLIKEFFICYECENWYLDKESCISHMQNCFIKTEKSERGKRRYEEKTAPLRQKKQEEKKQRFIAATTCEICQIRYSSASALNLHKMRRHSDSGRNFKCLTCGMDFKTKADLSCHTALHREKKISCSYCDFQSTSYNLKRHVKVVHLGIKNNVCEDC